MTTDIPGPAESSGPPHPTAAQPAWSPPSGSSAQPQAAVPPSWAPPAQRADSAYVIDPAGERPAPGRRRWLWAVPAVAVVVVGGGVAAAVALSGGGAQPDTVVPSNAVAYVRLDIDPSVGQKVAAVRFLGKLPDVKSVTGADDPRHRLFDVLKKEAGDDAAADIDYARDIEPWLGDRVAVAVLPARTGTEPTVMVAVQVRNEDAAKAGIATLTKGAKARPDVTFRDGYALISQKGTGAAITTALSKGSLASTEKYSGDMAAVGEQGVLSGWLDVAAVAKLSNGDRSTPAAVQDTFDKAGRAAFALRFEADYLELAGVSRGTPKVGSGDASGIGTLPASTVAAISVPTEGLVDALWKQLDDLSAGLGGEDLEGQIAAIEDSLGISLPEDLETLLGERLVLALPAAFGAEEVPVVGMRVTTDATKAEAILGKVEDAVAAEGGSLPLSHKADGSTLYLATTQGYLEELARVGTLGKNPAFALAVPDAGKGLFAAYVNLDELEAMYLSEIPQDSRELVKSLKSLGLTAAAAEDGYRFSLRLVGN